MDPSILIDNISMDFASDIVSSGLTSRYTGSRQLGGHREALVRTRSLQWYMTGINISMSRDLANRSLSIRLDAGIERPEERTGFRHQLPDDAILNREYYLSAALSLVQRWIDAGRPAGKAQVLASFEGWMRAVSGTLELAGLDGFNQNRDEFTARTDVTGAQNGEFVNEWYARHGESPQTPAELLTLAEGIIQIHGNGEKSRAQSLGHKLKKLVDQVYVVDGGEVAVRRHRGRTSMYRLEKI